MTRINCVPPEELTDKHLLAEYRELPRVFALSYGACFAEDAYLLAAGLGTHSRGTTIEPSAHC